MDDGMSSSNSTSVASRGTVKVKKAVYAVGLYWESVDDPSEAVKTARERASNNNSDFFSVFNSTSTTQIGFGQKSQGHKASMPVLAAHVLKGRKDKVLALFDLEDGSFYILGHREDGINPLLERVLGSRDEALDLFEDAKGQDWDELIAPDSFGWSDTIEIKLADALKGRPPVRLRNVNKSSNIIKFGVLGVIVLVGVLGLQKYNQMVEDQRIQQEWADKMAAAKNAVLPGQKEVKVPAPPWEAKVMGPHFLKNCVEDVKEFPLDIPGWNPTDFACKLVGNTPTVAAVLKRGKLGEAGGPITWIEPYVTTKRYKGVVSPSAAGSNDTVSVQWNIEKLPTIPLDVKTISVGKVKSALLTVMEARMTEVHFSLAADQFYRTLSFDFSTKLDPRDFIDVVSAIPGSVIDEMNFNIDTNTWKIKGKAYEQLPLPTNIKK